jgi:hypothetical protein
VTRGGGQVTLQFDAPAGDGGAPVTGYVATVHPDGTTVECAQSPCTVTGLTNGQAYTFTLHAINDVGDGAESEPSDEVTPAAAPDAPGSFTVERGDRSATLSFTAPAGNGAAITGFEVSVDGGQTWQSLTITAGNPITGTVSGLANGTSYDIEVRGVNDVGPGAPAGPGEHHAGHRAGRADRRSRHPRRRGDGQRLIPRTG